MECIHCKRIKIESKWLLPIMFWLSYPCWRFSTRAGSWNRSDPRRWSLIRTPKIPFIHSRASWQLALLTTLGIATGTIIPYTWLGKQLDMHHLPPVYYM